MKLIKFLALFVFVTLTICEKGGRIGKHGQMLFFTDILDTSGESNSIILYSKHLGGHEWPHDYQDAMIGRLELDIPVNFDGNQVYHFLPVDDSLDDWISGDLDVFTGELHDGTFYQGPVICKGKLFRLKGLWSNQLIDDTPTLPVPKYVVYNRVGNVYVLEHVLEGKDKAFQISVRAEINGNILNDGEIIEFEDLRNIKDDRLVEGKEYKAKILGRREPSEQYVEVKNVTYYVNPNEKKGGLKFLEVPCHHKTADS